jgi:aminopeptidase YwaD
MNSRFFAFVSLGLLLSLSLGNANAQDAPVFSVQNIRQHVTYLASNELSGRGSGTVGNTKAAQYIAGQFQKVGLKPMGTKGYFQPFSFPAGVAKGSKNQLSVQGFGRYGAGYTFEPSALSASGEVKGEMVYGGYGIVSKEANQDDYAGLDVKGKIVLVQAGLPKSESDNPHSLISDFVSIRKKAVAAREKGALALLVMIEPGKQPAFEGGDDSNDAGLPILLMRRTIAEAWLERVKKDINSAPFATGLQTTVKTDVSKVTKQTANIIGLLEGSDPNLKSEVVVVGAHMDHLGLGGAHSLSDSKKPAIHPGADDNASGTAGVLELAVHFAKKENRPKRSVLFMCFSGEELGLLGSAHYVKTPTMPLEKTVAMVNMDMIGRLEGDKLVVTGTGTSTDWNPLLDDINKSDVNKNAFRIARSESGFGASDQQSFYLANIPVLFFFTGLHSDYHRPSDTAEKINVEGEARILSLVAQTTARIASNPTRPNFTKMAVAAGGQPARFRVSLGSIPDYAYEGVGVQLSGVRENSPAAKAGLQKDDIIIKFGGKTILNVQEYTLALADFKPGDEVEIEVKRGDMILKVKAILAGSSR